jgi:hypothetical protein
MAGQGSAQDKFKTAQLFAVLIVFAAPIAYLGIVYVMQQKPMPTRPVPMLSSAALTVALLQIPMIFVVRRLVIAALRKGTDRTRIQDKALQLHSIGLVQAEFCFVLGLFAYMVTRDYQLLYYFYPVGMVASILVWPTRERFDAIVSQLEES